MNDLSSMNNLDKGDEGSVCNVYSVGEGSLLCGQWGGGGGGGGGYTLWYGFCCGCVCEVFVNDNKR